MFPMNPFCDSDFRNGLQLLAGINLMLLTFSVVVDVLAIVEVIVYVEYWNQIEQEFPVRSAVYLLGIDLFIIFLQIFYGCKLLVAVFDNNYNKCRRWYYPSILIYGVEVVIILLYVSALPSSPYFYYFVPISLVYKVYLFWPVKKFLEDEPFSGLINERTRLIRPVNY